MSTSNSPANQIEGVVLKSGWTVGLKLVRSPNATGGNFGVGYHVRRGAEQAFLKAIDFIGALRDSDPISKLAELVSHAQWERDMLGYCGERKMSRVVRLLDHEYVYPPGLENQPAMQVSCLVTEIGECDLRKKLDLVSNPTHSWKLHVLRDVALALDQLHGGGIAHQDVKPSNVISLPLQNSDTTSAGAQPARTASPPAMKLTDVGRVVSRNKTGPFDHVKWPGDWRYAPPEKFYGFSAPEWHDERVAADAYMLGSLLVYLFTGLPMTTLLRDALPEQFRPENWQAGFDTALLPVLVNAQSEVLALHLAPQLPDGMRDALMTMTIELTHPDPRKRGDPGARAQGLVGIDRYSQRFLMMAKRMDIVERKAAG